MDELILIKTLFAELIVKYKFDIRKAALEVCQGNVDNAEYIESEFRWDPFVLDKIKEYENIEENNLPTREEILKNLWDKANNKFVDPKVQVEALKLFSEMQGFVNKNSKIDVNTIPKVMIVNKYNNWEEAAIKQQEDLVNGKI